MPCCAGRRRPRARAHAPHSSQAGPTGDQRFVILSLTTSGRSNIADVRCIICNRCCTPCYCNIAATWCIPLQHGLLVTPSLTWATLYTLDDRLRYAHTARRHSAIPATVDAYCYCSVACELRASSVEASTHTSCCATDMVWRMEDVLACLRNALSSQLSHKLIVYIYLLILHA